MVAALHAGLGALLHEGLTASWERHAFCGRLLQDGLGDLGLELLVAPDHRLPQLTTVRIPQGVDDAQVRRELLSSYGIEIGAGAGRLAGQIWRIGCMGHTARRRNVVTLLGALKEVLGR
jgi:alanine-glyoxylate transaminase/serine-glyoxylate transaminase/serine-pyruvate transaminase